MPAALAHYCFALSVEPELSDAFQLGTQGPDPFFFYGMIPWKKRDDAKEVQNLGESLHKKDFSKLYAKMWVEANREADPHKKETLRNYVRGLLAHYCLDRTCHPYIFYRSGFDGNGQLTGHYSFAHKVFEALLDLKIASDYGIGRNPAKAMRIADEDAKSISKLWDSSLDGLGQDVFYQAYCDYLAIENFLQSRSGWKRPLWKLFGKEGAMYGFTYPRWIKKHEGRDIENLKNSVWKDPVTGKESTQSVRDLFLVSKALFSKADELLEVEVEEGVLSSSFLAFQEGIDHDGSPFLAKKTYRDEASPF